MWMPDLTPLFHMAIFGLICAVLIALGAIGTLIYFAVKYFGLI